MPPTITPASLDDLPLLLPLLHDFYTHEKIPFTPHQLTALTHLLATPTLGQVFLLRENDTPLGYFVLTFGYSLERAGHTALLDELYILPTHRNRGLGTAALHAALAAARTHHCHALHLEVAHANPAHALYTRLGFLTQNRHYLTHPLE
jgi:GNAT superfamily N-acetyltransferase